MFNLHTKFNIFNICKELISTRQKSKMFKKVVFIQIFDKLKEDFSLKSQENYF